MQPQTAGMATQTSKPTRSAQRLQTHAMSDACREVMRKRKGSVRLLTYPNSGEGWNAATDSWNGDPDLQADDVGAYSILTQQLLLVGRLCRSGTAACAC